MPDYLNVYAHVRLRLQRDAIDTLGITLDAPTSTDEHRKGQRER